MKPSERRALDLLSRKGGWTPRVPGLSETVLKRLVRKRFIAENGGRYRITGLGLGVFPDPPES
jgi:uncharacterized protein YjhX (UPF0386 family)